MTTQNFPLSEFTLLDEDHLAFYLGKRPEGDLIKFQCAGRPTIQNTARFVYVIGPFASVLGAAYYARFGQANPEVRTCADADRLALTDTNILWQVAREQIELDLAMSDEELAELRLCELVEYEPDKPMLGTVDVSNMFRQARVLEELY